MKFGTWLKVKRETEQLDLRSCADLCSVDHSTISRIEREKNDISFYSAFKIFQGFRLSPFQAFSEMTEEPSSEPNGLESSDDLVLRREQIEAYLQLYREKKEIAKSIFISLVKFQGENIQERDFDHLFSQTRLFQTMEMKYPKHHPEKILEAYQKGGAVMLSDVDSYNEYLYKKTRKRGKVLVGSLRMLGRISDGSGLEKTGLSDVVEYDQEAEQQGLLFGLYWSACEFYQQFLPASKNHNEWNKQEEWVNRLATLFLTLYRWYYLFGREQEFMDVLSLL